MRYRSSRTRRPRSRRRLDAAVVVDAILAKGRTDTGTRRDDADVVVGLGPGSEAGENVDAVVETDRGHELGRVFYDGRASPYDGEPGERRGYTHERVPSCAGRGLWEPVVEIDDPRFGGRDRGSRRQHRRGRANRRSRSRPSFTVDSRVNEGRNSAISIRAATTSSRRNFG